MKDLVIETVEETHLKIKKDTIKKAVSKIPETKIENNETKEKQKQKLGLPVRLKTLDIIPSMLFDMIDASFVGAAIKAPKSKWAELAPVLIVLIIGIVFLIWYMSASGQIQGLSK